MPASRTVLWCLFLDAVFQLSDVRAAKPNFVIFQPDDMPFLSQWTETPPHPVKAKPAIPTPNIDKLRSEGVVFTRAYASSAMCAPSRYSVLTGRYASRSVYSREKVKSCSGCVPIVSVPNTKLDKELTDNLQSALKALGYRTGVVGKWHLSEEGSQASQGGAPWLPTASQYPLQTAKAKATGMDFADGFYIGNLDKSCIDTKCKGSLGFSHNMEWVTAKALEFIQASVTAKIPFFLYMNPTVPHSPSIEEAFDQISVRATPAGTLSEDPLSGMPARSKIEARANQGKGRRDRKIGLTWIDDSFGAVYAKLKSLNVLDDTLLIFMLDHGADGKTTLYETGGRIALFARYPNHAGGFFKAGGKYEQLVSNIDVAPTFLALATGKTTGTNQRMDGVSWLDLDVSVARTLFVELNKDRAAVSSRYKLIQTEVEGYSGGDRLCSAPVMNGNQGRVYPGAAAKTQFYDLTTDSKEQTNLAGNSGHEAAQKALQAALDCHLKRTEISSDSFVACEQTTDSSATSFKPCVNASNAGNAGKKCSEVGNYHKNTLTYDANAGKFSGTMTTNLCPSLASSGAMGRNRPSCETQVIPAPGMAFPGPIPLLGRAGLSLMGNNIYSPYEAGFGTSTRAPPPFPCKDLDKDMDQDGYCQGGIDVKSCEDGLHVACGADALLTTLFLDACGGHASPYHLHQRPVCDYDEAAAGHSPILGVGLDGHGQYGYWETGPGAAPKDLDACNGHVGPVPANSSLEIPAGSVYHYHFTQVQPMTLGCYGPIASVDACKAFYKETCDDEFVNVPKTTGGEAMIYDMFCPCYASGEVDFGFAAAALKLGKVATHWAVQGINDGTAASRSKSSVDSLVRDMHGKGVKATGSSKSDSCGAAIASAAVSAASSSVAPSTSKTSAAAAARLAVLLLLQALFWEDRRYCSR